MRMNTKAADKMTNKERFDEVVLILSNCLLRVINDKQKQGIKKGFAGLQCPSKRSCTYNKNSKKRLGSEI